MLQIESILGLRHANTNPNTNDADRKVSPEGYKQIATVEEILTAGGFVNDIGRGFYGVQRHLQTLTGVMGNSMAIIETPTLYLPRNTIYRAACDATFAKHKYNADLAQWIAEDKVGWIPAYAGEAASVMTTHHCREFGIKNLAFVGSFNLVNAIGMMFVLMNAGLTGQFNPSIMSAFLKTKLAECEGFRLAFYEYKVVCQLIRCDGYTEIG